MMPCRVATQQAFFIVLSCVWCVHSLAGVRFVRIAGSSSLLALNEVEVYPCGSSSNVAIGKTATGSSIGSTCSGTRPPSLAVDGSTSCSATYSNTFCTSDSSNPYWQVDLGAVYDVCTVSLLQTTTGAAVDAASSVSLLDNSGSTVASIGLPGSFAILLSCNSTGCSAAAVTCAACSSSSCSSRSTSQSGNYPACSCSCIARYSGAFCQTPDPCTVALDCSNQAVSVSGTFGSCVCNCMPEWTGSACQTSNVCTIAGGCSNHATAVSGVYPTCSCTCSLGWSTSDCSVRICAIGLDCNATGTRVVTGTYPQCICNCKHGYGGAICRRTLTESVSEQSSRTASSSREESVTGDSPSLTSSTTDILSKSHTQSPSSSSNISLSGSPSSNSSLTASPSASKTRSTSVSLLRSSSRSTTASLSKSDLTRQVTSTVTKSLACRAVAASNNPIVQAVVLPAASPWRQLQKFEVAPVCLNGTTFAQCESTVLRSKPSLNERVELNFQKSWETTVLFPVTFVIRLADPVGRFTTLKHVVGTAAGSSLRLTATVTSEDSLTVDLVNDRSDSLFTSSSVFSSNVVQLTIPVSSFACVEQNEGEGSHWTLDIFLTLAGQPLVVTQSTLSSAGSGASIVAYASLNPSAGAAVSRFALLTKLLDCGASDPTQDQGNGVVGGLMFGEAVGQYMRGAIAGNVAMLYGWCAVLVLFGSLVGSLSGLKRGVPLASSCLLALDTLHLPSVFAVPLSQVLQPTVSACVSLLIVRGGVSIWDLVMSLLGAAAILLLCVFFVLVLLCNPCCSAVHRREAVQQKYFSPKNSFLMPLWLLIKWLFAANVRWVPAKSDQAAKSKQWKRRYLLLFEGYRVLWYPALDLVTSVGFGIVLGAVGALGNRTVCVGASIISLLFYLVLVVAAAVAGVGASRAANVILLTVNGLGLCASAALIAYIFKPSIAAANVATVCLMLSSIILIVVNVPSVIRVVARLFRFIKRHLWDSDKEEFVQDNPSIPCEETTCSDQEHAAALDFDDNEEGDGDRLTPPPSDSGDTSSSVSASSKGARFQTPFAEVDVDATSFHCEFSLAVMIWQQEAQPKTASSKRSWFDDVVAKSTTNELDSILNRDEDRFLEVIEKNPSECLIIQQSA